MVSGLSSINNELSKYGISSTGNIQSDLAALKVAKKAKGESTSDIDNFTAMMAKFQKSGKMPERPGMTKGMQGVQGTQDAQEMQGPQWTSLMQALGLDLQGSKEADFTAIQAKITQLESSTSLTADQKASLATLKAQFETIKKTEAQNHSDKGQKIGQQGQKPQGPQGEPQWFSLLKTLGIQPQGSKEADFSAIETKLTQMKSITLPTEQKANLESLQAQFEQYKNAAN